MNFKDERRESQADANEDFHDERGKFTNVDMDERKKERKKERLKERRKERKKERKRQINIQTNKGRKIE